MYIAIFSAGASHGNPGPIGIGGGLYDQSNREIAILSEHQEEGTQTEAEYHALIRLLEMAHRIGATQVVCHLSAEEEARQIEGYTFLPSTRILPLYLRIQNLLATFDGGYTVTAIAPRQNLWAEKLARLALDARFIPRGRPGVLDWAERYRAPIKI